MFGGNLRQLAYSVFQQTHRKDWSGRKFDGMRLAECDSQRVGADTFSLQLETMFGIFVTVRVLYNGRLRNPGGEYVSWWPWGWAQDAVRIPREGGQP